MINFEYNKLAMPVLEKMAFPIGLVFNGEPTIVSGLSKREYFAAHALTLFSDSRTNNVGIAQRAVQLADELIKELDKTNGT